MLFFAQTDQDRNEVEMNMSVLLFYGAREHNATDK